MARTTQPGTNGKKPKGRPSTYKEEYARQAYLICSETGADRITLSRIFKIKLNTIRFWCQTHKPFSIAIKKGIDQWDSNRVERSLLEKALGYEYNEITQEAIVIVGIDGHERMYIERKKGKGKDATVRLVEGVKRKVVTKRVPASDVAVLFWLQNRLSKRWKNVQRQIVTTRGEVDHIHKHELDLDKLGRNDLEKLVAILTKARDEENQAPPLKLVSGGA